MLFWLLVSLTVVLLLIGIYLFMIASRPAKDWKLVPFLSFQYAHRGLYTKDQTIPENSLAAFEQAVKNGYGAELDVQLSGDGQVVVFHDGNLERMCGLNQNLSSLTYPELKKFSLGQSQEKIPLFSDVLRLVDGRSPLIVELKAGKNYVELCRKTWDILKKYQGAYCIESFDPRIVRWFKKNAHRVIRGQLSDSYKNAPSVPPFLRFLLRGLFGNFLAKPHFIAYRHQDAKHSFNFKLCKNCFHLLTVAWTVREDDNLNEILKDFDLIIFEHFLP